MGNPLFLNYCKWQSTTSGTASFTVGAAAPADNAGSHDIPANCGIIVGNVYRYYAQSADGTQTEGGRGTYAAGSTLQRTTVLYNSDGTTSPVNFATAPIVDVFPNPSPSLDGSLAPDNFTVKGKLTVGDGFGSIDAGDIAVGRVASPTTGAIFLGNLGNSYLFFDGSRYQLPSYPLVCGSYLMGNDNLVYLNQAGSAYLQWNGGTTYTLGSSGTVWTSGNITPVVTVRTILAGDHDFGLSGNTTMTEPFGPTACATGAYVNPTSNLVTALRFRYLQYGLSNGGWYNFTAS